MLAALRGQVETAAQVLNDSSALLLLRELDAYKKLVESAKVCLSRGESLSTETSALLLEIWKRLSRGLEEVERGKAAARRVLGRRLPI